MLIRKLLVICLTIACAMNLLLFSHVSCSADHGSGLLASKNILVLHSYNQGFAWTDQEMDGIMEVLRAEDINYMPYVEYFDWKRFPNPQQLARTREHLLSKYQGRKIDAVIVTDNMALEFALENRNRLFPQAAIVFCGINGYSGVKIAGHGRLSGVVEEVDPAGTLRFILTIMPETREVVALFEDSESARLVRKVLEDAINKYNGKLKLRVLTSLTHEELIREIAQVKPGSVILQGPYYSDREGHSFNAENVIERILPHSQVPIFSMWDFLAGRGITGGSLLSGNLQGRNAALIALRYLRGETVIPVMYEVPTRLLADYRQLKRFGLDQRPLPKNIELINRPFSFLETYFATVMIVCAVFVLLLAIIAALVFNVRRRLQVESDLRASEESLATTFGSIGDAVIATDDNGRVVRMNRVAEQFTGWPEEEAKGKALDEIFVIINEYTRDPVENPVAKVLATGIIVGLANHTALIARDGSEMPIADSGAPIIDKRTGAVMGVVLVFRDVSAERAAEEALRQSEKKFSMAFHSNPTWMTISTLEAGRYLDANETFLRESGYTREEVIGHTSTKLGIWPDENERFAIMETIRKGGVIRNHEVKRRTKDGRIVTVLWSADLMDLDDEQCIISASLDITDRKQLEAESIKAQKLESLGLLAGGIAHDFNNLLTGILGNVSFAKLLIQGNEMALKRLDACENASLRASDLTSQLLTFARGGEPVRKLIALPSLVMDSATFVLRGSNVRCTFSFAEELWQVEADEGQISQVINNLVINADQAMPEGGVIAITATNVEVSAQDGLPLKEGCYVRTMLQDQGTGIDPAIISKLFDPYFTTKPTGSGLGLASVYSIINRHDGYVTADSRPGEGATFTFYLPAVIRSESLIEEKNHTESTINFSGKVLVMDDDEFIRDLSREILSHLGFDVSVCTEGAETLALYTCALASDAPFDIVIMDLTNTEGMGGKEAIQRLLMIDPAVRAIVSSGYSTDTIMADYTAFGFCASVTKPFRQADLVAAISQVLGQGG